MPGIVSGIVPGRAAGSAMPSAATTDSASRRIVRIGIFQHVTGIDAVIDLAPTFLDLAGAMDHIGGVALQAAPAAGTLVFARRMVPATRRLDLESIEAPRPGRARHDPRVVRHARESST